MGGRVLPRWRRPQKGVETLLKAVEVPPHPKKHLTFSWGGAEGPGEATKGQTTHISGEQ